MKRSLALLLSAAACTAPHSRPTSPRVPAVHTLKWTGAAPARFRIVPETVTVIRGDSIRFVVESGGPHNIEFDLEGLPSSSQAALRRSVPDQLSGGAEGWVVTRLRVESGHGFIMSTSDLPPGQYPFVCRAHAAFDEKGLLIVRRDG